MEQPGRRNFIIMGADSEVVYISRNAPYYRLIVAIDSRLPKHDQMEVLLDVMVELDDMRWVHIPAQFITDCHSTPPWSQSALPAYDTLTNLAAIAHDRLYVNWEEMVAVYQELEAMDGKAYADQAYLELMERFKPGSFRNRLYYLAVKLLGGWNWRKYRRLAKPP